MIVKGNTDKYMNTNLREIQKCLKIVSHNLM